MREAASFKASFSFVNIFFEEYFISSSEKKSVAFSNLTLSNLLVKLIKASSPFSLTLLIMSSTKSS